MFDDLKKQRKLAPREEDSPKKVEPKTKAKRGKRSQEGYRQRTVWLPDPLMKRVKAKLLDEDDRDFSDLVAELLNTWVDE